MMDAARHSVLGAIRHRLREARSADRAWPPDVGELPDAPTSTPIVDVDARIAAFAERLGGVGGSAYRAADLDAAALAVEEILDAARARSVAYSDVMELRGMRESTDAERMLVDAGDRESLFACDVGVSSAQWGVAETGSLVLIATSERHRLVSLVPPVHVAVLPVARLLSTMAEALAAVGTEPEPCITIVTGPSRTADIELQLVVGVHGPRELHVVLVDSIDPE